MFRLSDVVYHLVKCDSWNSKIRCTIKAVFLMKFLLEFNATVKKHPINENDYSYSG